MSFLTEREGAVYLTVQVSPRAGRTMVSGARGDVLKIKLAAAPVDGEANRALMDWLAQTLKISKSSVALVHGERGRRKILRIQGVRAADILSRLELSQHGG